MGLYDGSVDGTGSPADLAAMLGLSVILVVDCGRMAQSVAALVRGYATYRDDVQICGVILNKVGSARHETMLRGALDAIGMPVLGVLRQDAGLKLPERHLGLVQAGEHGALDAFIEHAATQVEQGCDLDAILSLARPGPISRAQADIAPLKPLGQTIAIARDIAFAFCYEHLLAGWRRAGAELVFFSPLADEAPDDDADAVYLPGGYPELHAGTLGQCRNVQIRHGGSPGSRRPDFRRMRWLYGAGRGACRCRWHALRNARPPAARHQFCRAKTASGLPAGHAAQCQLFRWSAGWRMNFTMPRSCPRAMPTGCLPLPMLRARRWGPPGCSAGRSPVPSCI